MNLCKAPNFLGGFEGSGGASGIWQAQLGGSGGGVINLTSEELLLINTVISAKGGNATLYKTVGSGGGSGGSIYITASDCKGSAHFDVSGGFGVQGGGGGSGGHLLIKAPSLQGNWSYKNDGGQRA